MKAVIASLLLTVVSVICGNSVIQYFKNDGKSKRAKNIHAFVAAISIWVAILLISLPDIWVV